jgi:hypothetical protein
MATGMKSMPPISSGEPNVYRCSPPPMSIPTVAIANPISAEIAPSRRLPPMITIRHSRPAMTTRNSSGGPKPEAISAVAGAATVSRIAPIVPATNEAIAAITSAGPALPCCANG